MGILDGLLSLFAPNVAPLAPAVGAAKPTAGASTPDPTPTPLPKPAAVQPVAPTQPPQAPVAPQAQQPVSTTTIDAASAGSPEAAQYLGTIVQTQGIGLSTAGREALNAAARVNGSSLGHWEDYQRDLQEFTTALSKQGDAKKNLTEVEKNLKMVALDQAAAYDEAAAIQVNAQIKTFNELNASVAEDTQDLRQAEEYKKSWNPLVAIWGLIKEELNNETMAAKASATGKAAEAIASTLINNEKRKELLTPEKVIAIRAQIVAKAAYDMVTIDREVSADKLKAMGDALGIDASVVKTHLDQVNTDVRVQELELGKLQLKLQEASMRQRASEFKLAKEQWAMKTKGTEQAWQQFKADTHKDIPYERFFLAFTSGNLNDPMTAAIADWLISSNRVGEVLGVNADPNNLSYKDLNLLNASTVYRADDEYGRKARSLMEVKHQVDSEVEDIQRQRAEQGLDPLKDAELDQLRESKTSEYGKRLRTDVSAVRHTIAIPTFKNFTLAGGTLQTDDPEVQKLMAEIDVQIDPNNPEVTTTKFVEKLHELGKKHNITAERLATEVANYHTHVAKMNTDSGSVPYAMTALKIETDLLTGAPSIIGTGFYRAPGKLDIASKYDLLKMLNNVEKREKLKLIQEVTSAVNNLGVPGRRQLQNAYDFNIGVSKSK